MNGSLLSSLAVMASVVIPREVSWSYFSFCIILAIGLITILLRGEWQKARGFDKLILFGPIFYAAPLACFGTEHFTLATGIAALVPAWIPWHLFWAYFVGTCFIAAALSLVTTIQARLTASLLALTFFLFVALMDAPGCLRHPQNRIFLALMLRELSFSAGPMAFVASVGHERATHILATTARYFIAIAVLVYSVQQFMHGDHVPGIPLEMVTPTWLFGHGIWTYLTAFIYAVAGTILLVGLKTRWAAICIGLAVFFVVLVVYVPIAVVGRASLESLNYMADTLMFGGTVLMLAAAMPQNRSLKG